MKEEFNKCSICGKKIGFFRKLKTRKLDQDPIHLIPLSQFCSDYCADIGLRIMLRKLIRKRHSK
jgi:endogenous inhibitor of DNA gyrase (YacG/DUF329 family)